MRKNSLIILFCLILFLCSWPLLAQEQVIQSLPHAIVADNREAVAEMVEYPFPQPYPLKSILNEQEFIMHYDRILVQSCAKNYKNPQRKTGTKSHGEVYISKMERFGFVIKA